MREKTNWLWDGISEDLFTTDLSININCPNRPGSQVSETGGGIGPRQSPLTSAVDLCTSVCVCVCDLAPHHCHVFGQAALTFKHRITGDDSPGTKNESNRTGY